MKNSTQYDDFGNVSLRSAYHSGQSLFDRRKTAYEYDQKGRFIKTKTKWWHDFRAGALRSIITRYKHDQYFGGVTKKSTPDGLQTTMEYDGFGRRVSENAPHRPNDPRYDINYALEWDHQPLNQGDQYYKLWVEDPSGPDSWTYYDLLGREIRTASEVKSHNLSWTRTIYNEEGQVLSVEEPRLTSEPTSLTEFEYDDLGRPVQTSSSNSSLGSTYKIVTSSYDYGDGELTKTTTNTTSGRWRSETTDAAGRVVRAADAGGELTYTYDSWGNLLTVTHGNMQTVENSYDIYGRQTALNDISAGTTQYDHNPYGELVWQQDANGSETYMSYDNCGRLVRREDAGGEVEYYYFYDGTEFSDNITHVVGPDMQEEFMYDDLHRLTQDVRNYDGQSFVTTYDLHDTFDHLLTTTYPSGVQVTNTYDGIGFLEQVTHPQSGTTIWQAGNMNGLGVYESYDLANGFTSTVEYEAGLPVSFNTPGIQELNMVWDHPTGDLKYRVDDLREIQEHFEYDDLDRLTQSQVIRYSNNIWMQDDPMEFDYDNASSGSRGNMVERTDIGKYRSTYHQVTFANGHDYPSDPAAPPLVINFENTREVSYTPFNQPASISEHVGGDDFHLTYLYGNDQQRCKSYLERNGDPLKEIWYNGSHEKVFDHDSQTEYDVHYIAGGSGFCAMIVLDHNTGDEHVYPVYADHLGSLVAITDVNGDMVFEQNFDAWGRKRDPSDWNYVHLNPGPEWLHRGFTGHEHLDQFTLINMNGRVYDPLTTKMLSPDNFVASATNTQAFNRYAYANSNPLKYVDPDGEYAILIGMGIAAAAYTTQVALSDGGFKNWNWESFGISVFMGGFSAGYASFVGTAVAPIADAGAQGLIQMAAHGTYGAATSAMFGGDPWSGFVTSAFSSGISSGLQGLNAPDAVTIASGGLTGGLTAEATGGDFIQGTATGLIVSGLNHVAHGIQHRKEVGLQVRAARAFLEDLGYPSEEVEQDVVKQKDDFFGKYYARLNNFASYASSFSGGHLDSYSNTSDSYLSVTRNVVVGTAGCCNPHAINEAYALKYYPSRAHSIGLTRVGFDHKVEAFLELLDGGWRSITGNDNVIYNMHERNARRYLQYR